MNGWQVVIWVSTCVLGVLMFLKLVSDAVAVSDRLMEDLDERQARARRRRMERAVLQRGAEERSGWRPAA